MKPRTPLRQHGFTMVTALFLLVVMAALGAFIAVVSTGQQMGSAMDLQGARAYQAARAGIEWGIYQVWNNNATRNGAGASPACGFADASFSFPGTTLAEFTVAVSCTRTPDPAGAANGGPASYTITATACNRAACPAVPDGSPTYVERRISVTI